MKKLDVSYEEFINNIKQLKQQKQFFDVEDIKNITNEFYGKIKLKEQGSENDYFTIHLKSGIYLIPFIEVYGKKIHIKISEIKPITKEKTIEIKKILEENQKRLNDMQYIVETQKLRMVNIK